MGRTKAVLIIGGSGFIGTHLALRLRESCKVFATFHRHHVPIPGVTLLPMALHNRDWAKRLAFLAQPDVIIYAAGSNDVAWNELNAHDSEHVHTGGAATICNVSDILQPNFIYLSNSHVFDGTKGNYRENDTVLPTTVLGKGKLGGENYIKSKSLNYVIVRSPPLLGRGNGFNLSFLDRLRNALDDGKRVELAQGELHNFATVDGLVELVARLVAANHRKRTFHYGGLTKLSYFDLGKLFARRFGYDPGLITPAGKYSTADFGPADYSLNSTLAVETLKIQPLFLEQSLDLLEKHLISRA